MAGADGVAGFSVVVYGGSMVLGVVGVAGIAGADQAVAAVVVEVLHLSLQGSPGQVAVGIVFDVLAVAGEKAVVGSVGHGFIRGGQGLWHGIWLFA